MSGIYGWISFDGAPLDAAALGRMQRAMVPWGRQRQVLEQAPGMAFGFAERRLNAAPGESLPRVMRNGHWLTAAARIDYRAPLLDAMGVKAAEIEPGSVGARQPGVPSDGELIEHAYLKWGASCTRHLYGDWAFAVWDPYERELFLARDHHGNTALYYTLSERGCLFASSRQALLAVADPDALAIDDLYLAQVLLSWTAYYGPDTVHRGIRRVPPAHTVTVRADRHACRRYWYLEHVSPQPVRSIEEAAEGFLPIFDAAVIARMRDTTRIATMLSGGLDSSSVTATAAHCARADQTLSAFTAVPRFASLESAHRFGDEWALAEATAQHIGRDHYRVDASDIGPLAALQWLLDAHREPLHATGNSHWLLALHRMAREAGAEVLLTGQGGNAGISWHGGGRDPMHERRQSWRAQVRTTFNHLLPRAWAQGLHVRWLEHTQPWKEQLAIHPDLVRRTAALARSVGTQDHPLHLPFLSLHERRMALIKPGASIVGLLHAEMGAATGLEVRDPTLDVRVLEFCCSIPDPLCVDPARGNRLLIRTAMQGRLPEPVRTNRRRGLQAADLCERLRAQRTAVEACIAELSRGPAAQYLNIPRLRLSWERVLRGADMAAHREASVVLTRALMVGLFVHQAAQPVALAA